MGRGLGDNAIYNSTYTWANIVEKQKYTGEIGILSSTTGNVYGIYDMSGGFWEYTAAFNRVDSKGYLSTYGWTKATGLTTTSGSTKYATAYKNEEDSSIIKCFEVSKIGDATKEVRASSNGWFNDYSEIIISIYPFIYRGGRFPL